MDNQSTELTWLLPKKEKSHIFVWWQSYLLMDNIDLLQVAEIFE